MNVPSRDKRETVSNNRRTIAFFGTSMHEPIVRSLWPGLLDAAQTYDLNLLYVAGERLHGAENFRLQANVLYELFDANRVDGIIVWSSTLVFDDEIGTLLTYFRHVPIVNIGRVIEGIPSLVMDNYHGMYAAMTHLIEGHTCSRIAFIRGPEDHFYAQERYRAYIDALEAHNIIVDPHLITPSYNWATSYGADAIHLLINERKLRPHTDIDAIVSVNDKMAFGAMQALQERGLKIPQDIPIIGFNDEVEGQFMTPALTSVRAPFYELGVQAMEVLLAVLAEESVPERVNVPARLIVRQSCGCLSPVVAQAAAGTISVSSAPGEESLNAQRAHLLTRIVEVLGEDDNVSPQMETFLDGFIQELEEGTSGTFLAALNEVLRQTIANRTSIEIWHAALSALRRHVRPYLKTHETLWRAEDLWQQARAEIGEAEKRLQGYHEVQHQQQTQRLRELGSALLTTFDLAGIMDILRTGLPQIGIPAGALTIYKDPQTPTAGGRLMLAYEQHKRLEIEVGGQAYSAVGFLPEGLLFEGRRATIIVEALYFQEEQLGFGVFEVGPRDGTVYDILRDEISSALQGALLVQRVRENAAEIARQKYILDTFMANIPDSIYFKDRQSRIIRMNQALANLFGLCDPADGVGKTDFDFFPEEQARSKYDQEQTIIRTGQPLLALEEPDAGGRWALTTKMPLRNEHGAIVGTFGLSRDITELKKAQQALQQAYSEISVLNVQLQEDNVRMSAELNVVKQLQQMILPRPEELRNISGLDIVGYMRPADEVGGDYYDVLQDTGIVHIGIGDVTGHGLESGVMMLMTQASIRTLIEHGETDPVKFVNTLNRLIYKNAQRMGTDKNLTFALIQYQSEQFTLVGQHEDVLVVRQDGKVERVDTIDLGFPVGLEPEINHWVKAATITLQPGEGIVLYTDGVTEAENLAQQQYGLDRLCAVISQHWNQSAQAIKQAIVDDVLHYIGTQKIYDDLTLVVLKQQLEQ